MSNTDRVDKSLFEESHYLGKPADANDLLVSRRIELLHAFAPFWENSNRSKLLEIGCGNGNTVLRLAPDFEKAVGLEYAAVHESEFLELKSELSVHNADFKVWDILSGGFDFEGGLADRLVSFEVIEHLPSEDGVANYAKSLKVGGIAAISVPNKWWIFETHGAKLPFLPWNRVPYFSWLPTFLHEKWAHARIYTRKRIEKLLEKHGFEVLQVQYVTAPMDVIKWKPLQHYLRKWVFRGNSTSNPFKAVSILVFCKRIR